MGDSIATDPAGMFALLLGIPGARPLELDDDEAQDVDLRLVIEVGDEPSMCVPCGATGTEIGRVVEDLGITSAGENVIRCAGAGARSPARTSRAPHHRGSKRVVTSRRSSRGSLSRGRSGSAEPSRACRRS